MNLSGRGTLPNNYEEEMALRQWLRLQMTDLYREGLFKLMPRLKKCITLLEDYVTKTMILHWNK